jgi:hypothetical protein
MALLLKEKDLHLLIGEDNIRGKFGSTHLDVAAQQTFKKLWRLLEEQMEAERAKKLAAADWAPRIKLQPSQPRDAGAMLASRPKRW